MEKLFALLVESGTIYCAIWVSVLAHPHRDRSAHVILTGVCLTRTQSGLRRGVPGHERPSPLGLARSIPGLCRRVRVPRRLWRYHERSAHPFHRTSKSFPTSTLPRPKFRFRLRLGTDTNFLR